MGFNIFNIVYIYYFYEKTDGFCGKRGEEEERGQGKVGENGMEVKGKVLEEEQAKREKYVA